MCGFLFEYSTTSPISKKSFIDVLNLSINRGPDHQGYWTNSSNVQMGFNRLAILDLSLAGTQPMVSPHNKFAIVFNGEIYNHFELRKQLTFNSFKGHSDTETITACLEEWGVEKTIDKLDGMFAIVIYEIQSDAIYLVRDFAGIKPLFYGWDGHLLVAASQYDQVIRHPHFAKQEVDAQVLKLYLQQHFMPAPFGLMRNTFQVEPGKLVQFKLGKKIEKSFWEFPAFYQADVKEQREALESIDTSLGAAVQQELLSDVPLGSFLSGGVDSPLISYYANKYKGGLSTFSIGSDSPKHDESKAAGWYADQIGTHHHTIQMKASNAEDIMEEVWSTLHEPMADFSIIPTYCVAKLARQHVTVALSGDGGDELFFGYERFWSIAKNIQYQHWPWLFKAGLYKGDQWTSGNKNVNSVLLSKFQTEAHQQLHSRFNKDELGQILPDIRNVSLPESYNTYNYPNCKDENILIRHMRKAEFYGMMQKTLRKVDLASMENSLEVRVPFLKKSFIEASLKIDPFLSYGNGNKKQILKDLLLQKIPGSPIDELKRGFTVPLGKWINDDLKEAFKERLLDKNFCNGFGIASNQVEALLANHSNGRDQKWPIFTLAALSAWHGKINA